jgi:GR25 family glycosyltransferase involved in LPS biosynthesis
MTGLIFEDEEGRYLTPKAAKTFYFLVLPIILVTSWFSVEWLTAWVVLTLFVAVVKTFTNQ